MAETKTVLIRDGEAETVVKATLAIITSALAASTAHLPQQDRAEIRRSMIEEQLPYFLDAQRRSGSLTRSESTHVNNATGYFSMLLDASAVQALWDGADKLRNDNS